MSLGPRLGRTFFTLCKIGTKWYAVYTEASASIGCQASFCQSNLLRWKLAIETHRGESIKEPGHGYSQVPQVGAGRLVTGMDSAFTSHCPGEPLSLGRLSTEKCRRPQIEREKKTPTCIKPFLFLGTKVPQCDWFGSLHSLRRTHAHFLLCRFPNGMYPQVGR